MYTCAFPGPDTNVLRHERQISASEGCSRHPYRITDREGSAIGYLPRKISPVCLGLWFQLPSEVHFRDRVLALV